MTQFYKSREEIIKKQPTSQAFANWLDVRFEEVKDSIKPELQNAVDVLSKQINNWGNVPHLEIEARIGYFDEDTQGNAKFPFDTDIGKEWYDAIIEDLNNDPTIISKEESSTTDYLAGTYRLTIDNKTQSRCAINKTTLEHSNFRYINSPFDLRISFCQEVPITVQEFQKKAESMKASPNDFRKKTRRTYHTNHWKYDITRVDYKKEQIERSSYQVEIEAKLENIPYHDYIYMADSLLLKVQKLVNVCEPEETDEEREMCFLPNISRKHVSLEEMEEKLKKMNI